MKRFTVDDGLEDVLCWEINDKENENMTCGECAKLLNELYEENQSLKFQLDECRNHKLFSRRELEKENEQLQQAYTQLKHRHSLLHDVCIDAECDRDSYRKDIASLEKENEQLKQRNNRQCKQLDRLYRLIEEKDWRTLSDIMDDFKKAEEQLQREWQTYW